MFLLIRLALSVAGVATVCHALFLLHLSARSRVFAEASVIHALMLIVAGTILLVLAFDPGAVPYGLGVVGVILVVYGLTWGRSVARTLAKRGLTTEDEVGR